MNNSRIIWIDWAKAIGIMIVVFCHVPQYDTLENRFLHLMQMPLFFMLSGYLHKVPESLFISFKKYWKTLLIPYGLFQLIFIPYFLIREKFDGIYLADIFHSIVVPFFKCFIGTPLDGPTWFIYALFIMKIFADITIKRKHKNAYILFLCGLSIYFSCLFNSDSITNISFTIDSLFDFLPFFFMGYYLKRSQCFIDTTRCNISKNLFFSFSFLLTSLIILTYSQNSYVYERLIFYIVGIFGSFFIIFLCKCFTNKSVIEMISSGTIVILGMHWMFIGALNVIFEKVLLVSHGILYTTIQAVLIVCFITFINYYIIAFCKRHFVIILGGRI